MEAHGSAMLLDNPALCVALALAVGMLSQILARHLRVPGIVILLAAGVLLGPDVSNIVRPESALGKTVLQTLVGYAVAIILFEGGLSLKLAELRKEARAIRQLITTGAAVTAIGGMLAARYFMDWNWTLSVLFGTLVIVTGPTVINPLLRRIRVTRKLATVLEAEGVFIDAVGAITAVVALEIVISGVGAASIGEGLLNAALRLGLGGAIGLAGGLLIVGLLRREGLVPEGLENVTTLSLVLVIYQFSSALMSESGIGAVTVAGLVVGNMSGRIHGALKEFKEQLTVMFIGMLFVLLAADVRIADVQALGVPGLLTVAALMLLVRPANIMVGTWKAEFTARERAFLSWMAPRGIVAAAVASLFAVELEHVGIEGGTELRAMVFLVIAVTVLVQGLTGGLVATLLGVKPKGGGGYAILGAQPITLSLATTLRDLGHELVIIDSNPTNARQAQELGFRAVYGSGLAETVLKRAGLAYREGVIGATGNESVNFSFGRRAALEFRLHQVWVALRSDQSNVTTDMVKKVRGRVLFGHARNMERWNRRLVRNQAEIQRWRRTGPSLTLLETLELFKGDENLVLGLAVEGKKKSWVFDDETSLKTDDFLYALLPCREAPGASEAAAWMVEKGFIHEEGEESIEVANAAIARSTVNQQETASAEAGEASDPSGASGTPD